MKAFATTAKSYAGRGCEVHELEFTDVEEVVRPNGNKAYAINFMRRKTQGTMEKDFQYVIGDVEVQILRDYISCFPLAQRTGRFFRKLSNKNGKICSTNQVIGKNMVSNYGKEIARILDLPDPDRFTGHCWRRTAVTLLANKGLSLPQIKCMSGHK